MNFNLDDYLEGYDTSNVTPATGVAEPIPEGDYNLECCAIDLKPTKAQTGLYLALTFRVLDPEYDGRQIFVNMNIKNPNADAMRIGLSELAALAVACGSDLQTVKSDTSLVYQVPFVARVGIEAGRDGYGPKNKILRYYPAAGAAPASAMAPAPAPRPAAPAPAARPPGAAPAARPAAPAARPAAGGGLPWANRGRAGGDIPF